MAVHFNTRVYGMIEGNPPFTAAAPGSRIIDWGSSAIMNFPTNNTIIHPFLQGVKVANFYCYGIVEVLPSGLNVHGQKYATDTSAATLASTIG